MSSLTRTTGYLQSMVGETKYSRNTDKWQFWHGGRIWLVRHVKTQCALISIFVACLICLCLCVRPMSLGPKGRTWNCLSVLVQRWYQTEIKILFTGSPLWFYLQLQLLVLYWQSYTFKEHFIHFTLSSILDCFIFLDLLHELRLVALMA